MKNTCQKLISVSCTDSSNKFEWYYNQSKVENLDSGHLQNEDLDSGNLHE